MLNVDEIEAELTKSKTAASVEAKVTVGTWIKAWNFCKHYWEKTKRFLSRLPIIGPIFDCKWDDHLAAFKETSFNVIFATMPIWLTAVIRYPYNLPQASTQNLFNEDIFFKLIIDGIGNGELYVLSTSILAPILFLTWLEPKPSAKKFPAKFSIGLSVIIVLIVSASSFAATKVNQNNMNQDYMLIISSVLALAALILRYLSTVYDKYLIVQNRPNPFNEGENELLAEVNIQRNAS
ncbi:MAG: hypothetical protein Q8R74_11845 [Methylophilus sp.]|nr:hypothetical protein [Methylophilus sp.]